MLQPRILNLSLRSSLLRRLFSTGPSSPPPTRATSAAAPPRRPTDRFSSYLAPLRLRHPNIDPASLVASFLVLHELTAIVPLILGFFSFKSLGLGAGLLAWVVSQEQTKEGEERPWFKDKVERWIHEGETRAQRIGRRYGVFGFEKESQQQRNERKDREKLAGGSQDVQGVDYRVGGDVANLVASYLAVKALLPLRIYVSLRFAPPLANTVMKRFHRLQAVGARYLKKAPKVE